MNENPNQPALWPKDELKMFLMAYDIDVEDFENDELVALAMSLIVTNDNTNDNDKSFEYNESDFASPPPPVRSPNMTDIQKTSMDEINRFLDIPEETSNILNSFESFDDSFDFDDVINSEDNNNNNNTKIDNYLEIKKTFCEITSCDLKSAEYYLEAYNYDLNGSIAFFMEQNENKSSIPPSITNKSSNHNNFYTPYNNSNDINWDNTSNDINELLNNLSINPTPINNIRKKKQNSYTGFTHSQMREIRALESNNYDDSDDDGYDYDNNRHKKTDEYDENGIRRPDSIKKERLLGGGGFVNRLHTNGALEDFHNPLDRADVAGVEWMFPPANHLSYTGSFAEVRRVAASDSKWILINIQNHTEFSSHVLNRDTWKDENVESIIRNNFIFWQRGHTSQDAIGYMRLHNLSIDNLPHIAIIDTRTGAKVINLTGHVKPDALSAIMIDFLNENNIEIMIAPNSKNLTFQNNLDINNYEDDDNVVVDLTKDIDNQISNAIDKNKIIANNIHKPPSPPLVEIVKRVDYGDVPNEPEDGIRISIKLANGKAYARKYNKSDKVRSLFAVASNRIIADNNVDEIEKFEILSSYPSKVLSEYLDSTLEELGLSGSQVIMRYL